MICRVTSPPSSSMVLVAEVTVWPSTMTSTSRAARRSISAPVAATASP
ncbi:MAG: hypothetical protein QF719_07620 [Chloroflexota bacterium]|nr:hypothetical protein [Chloroflexota bacterium]MDP6508967.1 hypothetical protein [Chloroflexota bacterium]MDP6758066.1 hypothetical protein [Chloroflexota bacterium]